MTEHDVHDLAAAFALDALDEDERTVFEAHHPTCETCTAEIAEFRETAATLATDTDPPPEHLEATILATIAHTPQVSSVDGHGVVDLSEHRRRRRQILASGQDRWFTANRLIQAVAVVAVFAAGLVIGTNRVNDGQTEAGEIEYAGAIGTDSGSIGQLSIIATGIGRVIQLDTEALPILPTGEYYEIWFVARDDTASNPNRISAGTFHPDPIGNVNVQFAAAVDPALYPTVEITAEPADGNPAATGATVASTTIEP